MGYTKAGSSGPGFFTSLRKVFLPLRLFGFQEVINFFAQLADLKLHCQNQYQKKHNNYREKDVHNQTSS
jgi:hypothetical protein